MSNISNCPFCGSDRVEAKSHAEVYNYDQDIGDHWWMVFCHTCGAMSGSEPVHFKAIESWNRREERKPSVQKVSSKITIIKE